MGSRLYGSHKRVLVTGGAGFLGSHPIVGADRRCAGLAVVVRRSGESGKIVGLMKTRSGAPGV